jgi:AcrR family transcriptional regulator
LKQGLLQNRRFRGMTGAMEAMTPVPAQSAPGKGQRTASRILDVAEELFARDGYAATSLRDIAGRIGIQQPGLYRHFASKEDLYRRVFERALKPLFDLMDGILAAPADSPLPDDLAARMTDLLALHPNIARLLMRAASGPATEGDEIAAEWLGRLVAYGRQLTEKAGYAVDERALALHVVAVFNVLFGYFAAAPLVRTLAGRDSDDPALLAVQKQLVQGLVASFQTARLT